MVEIKDQGGIHIDTGCDQFLNGMNTGRSCRNLDQDIGSAKGLKQTPGLRDGAIGIMGQVRAYFQADIAVSSPG